MISRLAHLSSVYQHLKSKVFSYSYHSYTLTLLQGFFSPPQTGGWDAADKKKCTSDWFNGDSTQYLILNSKWVEGKSQTMKSS